MENSKTYNVTTVTAGVSMKRGMKLLEPKHSRKQACQIACVSFLYKLRMRDCDIVACGTAPTNLGKSGYGSKLVADKKTKLHDWFCFVQACLIYSELFRFTPKQFSTEVIIVGLNNDQLSW